MSLEQIATSMQSTSLSEALKDISWLVPALQSIHILMVGVVFVSMLAIALRVLGLMRAEMPLPQVWTRFAPFFWTGLAVMALTGALLTIAEPVRELMTLSFRIKVVLLAIGIASAAAFGRGVRVAAAPASGGLRVAVLATVALWLAIILLGRAIAYDTSVWGGWSPVKSLGGAAT